MAALGDHTSVEVMNILLTNGADPNSVDNEGGPVLNTAIESGNIEVVKLLIDRGAILPCDPDSSFEAPLKSAAELPDSAIFDYIMEVGEPELTDYDYGQALAGAAYAGNTVRRFVLALEYWIELNELLV